MTKVCPRLSRAHIQCQESGPSPESAGSVALGRACVSWPCCPAGLKAVAVPPGDPKGNSQQVSPFGLKMRGKNLVRGACHPHTSEKQRDG